jgi:hypothetical protein
MRTAVASSIVLDDAQKMLAMPWAHAIDAWLATRDAATVTSTVLIDYQDICLIARPSTVDEGVAVRIQPYRLAAYGGWYHKTGRFVTASDASFTPDSLELEQFGLHATAIARSWSRPRVSE